jgi:hypothetical protein
MKSKQYPYEVYVLRKGVNLSSESSQLCSGETVNQIRMGRQVLNNKAPMESTAFRKRHNWDFGTIGHGTISQNL